MLLVLQRCLPTERVGSAVLFKTLARAKLSRHERLHDSNCDRFWWQAFWVGANGNRNGRPASALALLVLYGLLITFRILFCFVECGHILLSAVLEWISQPARAPLKGAWKGLKV